MRLSPGTLRDPKAKVQSFVGGRKTMTFAMNNIIACHCTGHFHPVRNWVPSRVLDLLCDLPPEVDPSTVQTLFCSEKVRTGLPPSVNGVAMTREKAPYQFTGKNFNDCTHCLYWMI